MLPTSVELFYYFAHTCEIQSSIYFNIFRLRRNKLPQAPLSKLLSPVFSRSRNYRLCIGMGVIDSVIACGIMPLNANVRGI